MDTSNSSISTVENHSRTHSGGLSLKFPLRMNGKHRTQSDQARFLT